MGIIYKLTFVRAFPLMAPSFEAREAWSLDIQEPTRHRPRQGHRGWLDHPVLLELGMGMFNGGTSI